jgi:hypothetical protein
MIGSVVRQQQTPEKAKQSHRLRDALMRSWSETRESSGVSLVEQEEVWKEFWLYASNTKNWCPRLCVINAMFKQTPEVFAAETMWNFDQGHAYHSLFQEKILPSLGDKFLGAWQDGTGKVFDEPTAEWFKLPEGHELVRGITPYRGEFKGMKYAETKIRVPGIRLVVKFDGFIRWSADEGLEIQEIKTEREDARDQLDPMVGGGPRPAHVEQVMLAMHAAGVTKARITYVFKGANSFSSSMIEHEIPYDQEMVDRLCSIAKRCVDAVRLCDEMKADNPNDISLFDDDAAKGAWLDGMVQRLSECPMKSKGRAMRCSGRDDCFPGRGKKK